jgi:peroxiredoxin
MHAVVTEARSQTGKTLAELSTDKPLLVVFLRHAGCTFCREALVDIAAQRRQIEDSGVGIALVLMSSPERATQFVEQYHLEDVPRFSDPDQKLYEAFELKSGSLGQLFGPQVLWRGLKAAIFEGHGFGWIEGNGFRMPGAFLLHKGEIVRAYRHKTAADRPNYAALSCPVGGEQS